MFQLMQWKCLLEGNDLFLVE